jgi:hypothetical protein
LTDYCQHKIEDMECIILKDNVKIFAQILHTLAKIGELISFDGKSNVCGLGTFNAAKSAYVAFSLKPNFFGTYQGKKNASKSFRIQSKVLINIFKNVSKVNKIRISANDGRSINYIVITLTNDDEIEKVYQLHYEEANIQNVLHDPESYPVVIESTPYLLNVCLSNFHKDVEEITMSLESSVRTTQSSSELSSQDIRSIIRIMTYFEDQENIKSTLMTSLAIDTAEFVTKKNNLPPPVLPQAHTNTNLSQQSEKMLEMTFNNKYLRAFLTFCESANQPVEIFLDQQGR